MVYTDFTKGGDVMKTVKEVSKLTGVSIRALQPEDVIDMLHHQAFVSDDPALQKITAGLVDRLAQKVALWEMECTKDPRAAEIAHKAMSQIK